ncbi:MAG: hypothetical protein JRD89_02235 [Deltaproteobacteria bacterium]|nr:hypothetical protein [Deltaproteobacteria bacterium]
MSCQGQEVTCWTSEQWQIELVKRDLRGTKTVVHGCDESARRQAVRWWMGIPVAFSCQGVFRCKRCRRLVCWCTGGAEQDERGEYCADCWVKVTCPDCDGVLRGRRGKPSIVGVCACSVPNGEAGATAGKSP